MLLLLLVLAPVLFTAAPVYGADAPLIFVSIPPQKSFVEHVAGSLVQVEVLLPPGTSPATYEPTPHQMAALERADLYLRIGVPFEGPLLRKAADLMPDLRIIDCRRGVELVPMAGHAHEDRWEAPTDPHIWLDPMRVKTIAANITDAFSDLLPGSAAELDRNLTTFLRELDRVDGRVAATLAPLADREVLVFHPAFGYFTRRYGLLQLAVEAEGKAPTARQLATIVEAVERTGQTTLFAQPQFSASSARTVADAVVF